MVATERRERLVERVAHPVAAVAVVDLAMGDEELEGGETRLTGRHSSSSSRREEIVHLPSPNLLRSPKVIPAVVTVLLRRPLLLLPPPPPPLLSRSPLRHPRLPRATVRHQCKRSAGR